MRRIDGGREIQIGSITADRLATGIAYTDDQVFDVISGALVAGDNVTITPDSGAGTITIDADGGGTDLVTWTKLIDTDPMSALTNWTSRSGTWTAGGTYGVEQTNTGSTDAFLECNTNLSAYDYRAIEATVRTNSGKVGFGFADSGTWNTGDVSIALDSGSDLIWWDRFGIGGSQITLSLAANTDYVLKIVERVLTTTWWVYVDGVKRVTVNVASSNIGRVGLYTRSGAGWFRDVTVWGGAAVFNVPT